MKTIDQSIGKHSPIQPALMLLGSKVKPWSQMQAASSPLTWQVANFPHSTPSHGAKIKTFLVWLMTQLIWFNLLHLHPSVAFPMNPSLQTHLKCPFPLMQTELSPQGYGILSHSLISTHLLCGLLSIFSNPALHEHSNPPSVLMQIAPCPQKFLVLHSSTSWIIRKYQNNLSLKKRIFPGYLCSWFPRFDIQRCTDSCYRHKRHFPYSRNRIDMIHPLQLDHSPTQVIHLWQDTCWDIRKCRSLLCSYK